MIQKIFLFIFITIISSCCLSDSDSDLCRTTYQFDFPITLYPAIDTFQINDTVWLEMQYAQNLFDRNSATIIEVGDFDFELELLLGGFDLTGVYDAIESFEVVAIQGNVTKQILPVFSSFNLEFEWTNNEVYALKLAIIPKNIGNFSTTFNDGNFLNRDVMLNEDSPCKERLQISYSINHLLDNNYEFYINNSSDEITTLEGYNYAGTYSFVVTE
ncbi:MAG: hypothetical protein ACPG5B_16965 [Chitinophagales bacterium]